MFTRADDAHLGVVEDWMDALKKVVGGLDQRAILNSDPVLFTNKVMPRVNLISFVHQLSKMLSEARS